MPLVGNQVCDGYHDDLIVAPAFGRPDGDAVIRRRARRNGDPIVNEPDAFRLDPFVTEFFDNPSRMAEDEIGRTQFALLQPFVSPKKRRTIRLRTSAHRDRSKPGSTCCPTSDNAGGGKITMQHSRLLGTKQRGEDLSLSFQALQTAKLRNRDQRRVLDLYDGYASRP